MQKPSLKRKIVNIPTPSNPIPQTVPLKKPKSTLHSKQSSNASLNNSSLLPTQQEHKDNPHSTRKYKSVQCSPERSNEPNTNSSKNLNESISELDYELLELYKKYTESKTNRQRSQDDYKKLNNKLNSLHNEENKMQSRKNMIDKLMEKNQKTQFKNLEQKEKVTNAKVSKE